MKFANIWNTNYAETLNQLKPSQEGELKNLLNLNMICVAVFQVM